jgi:hypothetical protein
MEGLTIRRRVDGYSLDSELVERADHAHCDLAPIRDEDAREHVRRSERLDAG